MNSSTPYPSAAKHLMAQEQPGAGRGEVRWLSSTIEGGKKDNLPPSHQVTGLLGSESRKYISPFVFTSITFPGQVTMLKKWTKE